MDAFRWWNPFRYPAPLGVEAQCEHLQTVFDEVAAAKCEDAYEVRRRWPRFSGKCSCGFTGVYYVSFAHYIMGDY